MKKSISKRIRITKRGKLIRRKMGVNHFRAKKSGKRIRNKREQRVIAKVDLRNIRTYASSILN